MSNNSANCSFVRIYHREYGANLRSVETANRLQLGDYEDSVKESIRKTMTDGLTEGKSYGELVQDLKELGDKAARYAETLASTHLKRYSRSMKYQKTLISGTDIFMYAGVLRDTTRAFCRPA